MASLPTVLVGNTIKLPSEFKKFSPASFHYEKKKYSTKELEFREAVSFITQGNTTLESSSYVPILQEYIDRNSLSGVETIHANIIKTDFGQELFLMTFLVNAYAKCGTMESARKVFDNLSQRNVVTWTSLMSGYVYNARPLLAIDVFNEMLEAGCYPTNFTLGIVLNACSALYDVDLGDQIHGYIVKYDIQYDTSVGNALCSLYSRCHCFDLTIKAFERIEEKNLISWTTAISACGVNGDCAMGLDMFVRMLSEGLEPNEVTLTSVLSLCCTLQDLVTGSQVHSLCVKLGYGSDVRISTSVMYLYLKSGCISAAKKLFDKMNFTNVVTWNAMIAGHAEMTNLSENGLIANFYGIEALRIYQRMNLSGLKPDLYTFSSLLTVCSSLVALEQGEQVHARTMKSGFLSDVVVGTALVNMYSKCGSIDRASKAFVEIGRRTLISWTSMITAYVQNGRPQQALNLFEDMRFVGVRPNTVTFVSVLSACSQVGIVDKAMSYYDMMKNEYNIEPVIDHNACLIDMFVRLGRIEEAFDFITKIDLKPNEFIWSMLIAGCKSQGKLELAFSAAEQLLELKPKDSETYTLLLNMYMSVERWKDVSRVRKLMRDEKIDNKLSDWSWVSIKQKVYSFKPGDKKHKSDEVAKLLEDLIEKARAIGYGAETNLELLDEEKEETTANTPYQSEKLAVAFSLLNTSNAAKILVVKSTSMYKDSHNFMKIVSKMTSRTITIRDSKQLHNFFDGQCSCGDFGCSLV